MKCNICIAAAAAALATTSLPSAYAFSPTTRIVRPANHGRATSNTKLLSTKEEHETTTTTTNGEWNIGTPSRSLLEANKKKAVAKQALTKLLERQQRDVQQTLDLMENLDIDYDKYDLQAQNYVFTNDTTIVQSTNTTTSNGDVIGELDGGSSSITASIAAGADYGYISRSEGCKYDVSGMNNNIDERFADYGPPGNILSLGSQQFMRNLNAMIGEYKEEESNPALTPQQRELQHRLQNELTLDSSAIWDRERARGEVVAPWIIKIPYFGLCYLLDVVFEGRNPFSRFFLLETVARMPYFSYITMLHLYETLGFWRRSAGKLCMIV